MFEALKKMLNPFADTRLRQWTKEERQVLAQGV